MEDFHFGFVLADKSPGEMEEKIELIFGRNQ